jgi:uncharacterized membrane protein YeiB
LAGTFKRSLHQQHRSLSQVKVLEFIRDRIPRQWGYTEVVGQWVWVHLSRSLLQLERAWLFELGFHFSPRRRAFQHPCGVPSSPGRQPFATYFPAEQASAEFPEFAPHF